MESPQIRRALLSDLPAITAIYNEAVLTTTATFDTRERSPAEQLAWFNAHDERFPILAAVIGGEVVGWCCLSRWSDRCAYDGTAETSIYVRSDWRGRGIGRALKLELIAEARRLGFRTLIARVAEESEGSLRLNRSLGFRPVGTLEKVGSKFGRLLDVQILQLMLE